MDVNIYASSTKDAWPLVGNHENTEVGNFLADYLDLDIDSVTKRLQSSGDWTPGPPAAHAAASADRPFTWMGDPLSENVRTEGLDTYHGDYRKRGLDLDVDGAEECGCGGVH